MSQLWNDGKVCSDFFLQIIMAFMIKLLGIYGSICVVINIWQ